MNPIIEQRAEAIHATRRLSAELHAASENLRVAIDAMDDDALLSSLSVEDLDDVAVSRFATASHAAWPYFVARARGVQP